MIRLLMLVFIGLSAFAAVFAATRPIGRPEPAAPPAPEPQPIAAAVAVPAATGREPVTAELRSSSDAGPRGEIIARQIRNVTPPNMTAGPVVEGPLERVEPPVAERETEAPKARIERLYHAIVVSAGTIKVRDGTINLAGITAPTFDRRCGEGQAIWPCGRMARAHLRRFIRGRAIECAVPAGATDIPDPASCQVAGEDIAAWLVEHGWASADGGTYAAQEKAARQGRLGLWGERRPGHQLTGPQPAETVDVSDAAPESDLAISSRVSGTP